MATKCRCYLPRYQHTSIWYLKDLATGVSKRIPAEKAMHIHIPYYESLTIPKFLAFAATCKDGIALQYLPKNKLDMDKLPR